jgi:hypothetical protein
MNRSFVDTTSLRRAANLVDRHFSTFTFVMRRSAFRVRPWAIDMIGDSGTGEGAEN